MVDDYRWVLELIDRFYGAAGNDDEWPELLKDLVQFLEGLGTTLHSCDSRLQPIDRVFSYNVSDSAIADYLAHFHTVDIRKQRAVSGPVNRVVTDADLVDDEVIANHEFYQDFLRPIGYRHVISAIIELDDGSYAFCSSHRGLNQDHADRDVLDRAGLLLPHLRRSLQLRRRLSVLGARGQAALDLLDGLGQAVFMIGSHGRIIWQNSWSDRILNQQDGLIISDGELHAVSAAANAELQQLVKAALLTSSQPRTGPGGLTNITRPSLKRPYQVLVTPLSRSPERNILSLQLNVVPAAAIFVMDLEQKSVPSTDVLRTLYKLTPAEARLAIALGSGISLKAYAERAKLSIHYVRWLLKQVEAKTDTRRMSDLIRLLARQTGVFGAVTENGKGKDR